MLQTTFLEVTLTIKSSSSLLTNKDPTEIAYYKMWCPHKFDVWPNAAFH